MNQSLLSHLLDVQKVEKLKALCLQYATSIQLLMPSIEVANSENTSKAGKSKSRTNISQDRDQQLKLASENVVMSESILYVSASLPIGWCWDENSTSESYNITLVCRRKFEAAFNSELQSLAPTLSNSSHAEPYLTHLAQCILGVRMDQWIAWCGPCSLDSVQGHYPPGWHCPARSRSVHVLVIDYR